LREWGWAERPTGVVALTSGTHPLLVSSLARALSQMGRMDYLGELGRDAALPPVSAQNSAYRVAQLWGTFSGPQTAPDRPAPLVAGPLGTGWPATEAGRHLRAGGASAALPLAVASTGWRPLTQALHVASSDAPFAWSHSVSGVPGNSCGNAARNDSTRSRTRSAGEIGRAHV